jgi:hypothetical protein
VYVCAVFSLSHVTPHSHLFLTLVLRVSVQTYSALADTATAAFYINYFQEFTEAEKQMKNTPG